MTRFDTWRIARWTLAVPAVILACTRAPDGPDITVQQAWARPMTLPDSGTAGSWNSAVYLQIVNHGRADDRLTGASSDAAAMVEVHESRIENGVMRMRRLDRVTVAAGNRVVLEQGGLHIMLMGIRQSLMVGDTIEVTLAFETAPPLTVRVPVEQH